LKAAKKRNDYEEKEYLPLKIEILRAEKRETIPQIDN